MEEDGESPEMLISEWPEVLALFEDMDEDSDGTLSHSELKNRILMDQELVAGLAEVGKNIDDIIEQLDVDGDQRITKEEFTEILEWEEPLPENPDPKVDRTATKLLRIQDFVAQSVTYNTNDTKEKLVLEYVENFNKQFTQLYVERRPLLLCPRNECGVRKFVCTTIRPTKLQYKDLYNFDSCAKFVSNYLLFEPMSDPLTHPTYAPSPHSVMQWQRGDSLDFANALCSLLLGVGYDAYIVSGYAPPHVCKGDETKLTLGSNDAAQEDEPVALENMASPKTRAAPRTRVNPYEYVPPKALESDYEKAQAEKERLAAAAAKANAAIEEPEAEPTDFYKGMRVHYWVLLRVGKRTVSQPLFIDPVSGRVYPVAESPFLGVESVWNNTNYFVNMQDADVPMEKLSWKLQNPALWEFVFYEQPTGDFDLGLDATGDDSLTLPGGEEAPESVASPEAAGDDAAEILEVPPSWGRKISISQNDFNKRALGGEKMRGYSRCKLEIFAEYHRTDGCTSILTTYADDECTDMVERQSHFEHRLDKLYERLEFADGSTHEKFLQGHRELTGQATYGGQATGRVTGLKDVIETADSRTLLFYSSARLDGLEKRVEEFGKKCTETYKPGSGGKKTHLVFRSVCFETDGKTPEELRGDKETPLTEMKIRKMTEKYERNPDVPVEQDVWKKTFYHKDYKIKYSYHHEPQRITRRTRMFSKMEENNVDALESTPISKKQYDDLVKMPKVLEDEMKETLTNLKDAEHEAKAILAARDKDEQDIQLEVGVYEMIRRRIEEGGSEATEDDKSDLIQERDYLKPYLPPSYTPHDMEVRLLKDEAIHVKEDCLKALKDRLIERANIIQSRLDGENAILARKQAAFQRTRDHATPEAEEEYEEFCAEAWFRIQILEQRLARHEDQALQKFAELDTKLRNDPRLSCLHDFA